MNRLIVLDTETTGLDVDDGHRVIEIGCVEIIDRSITDNFFHYYINGAPGEIRTPDLLVRSQAL